MSMLCGWVGREEGKKTPDPLALALRLADTPMRALEGAGKWKNFGVPNDIAVELLTGRESGPTEAN